MKKGKVFKAAVAFLLSAVILLAGCNTLEVPNAKTSISLYQMKINQPFDNFFGQDYYKLVYDGLFTIDYSGNIVPQLVEEYEYLTNTLLSIKIREGVTFHDGTPLEASDCVDTLLRQAQIVREVYNQKYFINILNVYYLGSYQFEIELEKPDPYFLRYLTFGITKALNPNNREEKPESVEFEMRGSGVKTFYGDITDIDDIKYHNLSPISVGSGPYMVSSEVTAAGVEQKLIAYEDYWRGKPLIDEIIGTRAKSTDYIRDAEHTITGLINGDFSYFNSYLKPTRDDMYGSIKKNEAELKSDPALQYLETYNQISSVRLALNFNKAPLDSPDVRKALVAALSSDNIIDTLSFKYSFGDFAFIRNEHSLLNQDNPAYFKAVQTLPAQEVSELLSKAGLTEGITLSFIADEYSSEISQAITDEFAKNRIYLEPSTDSDAHLILKRNHFSSNIMGYQDYLDDFITFDRIDDLKSFYYNYLESGGEDTRLLNLIEQLRSTTEQELRDNLAVEAVLLIQDEVYEIPVLNEVFLWPYHESIKELALDSGINLAEEIFGIP